MICKICYDIAVVEKGWFNIAAMMYPLCKIHFKEYVEFKEKFCEKI